MNKYVHHKNIQDNKKLGDFNAKVGKGQVEDVTRNWTGSEKRSKRHNNSILPREWKFDNEYIV